jgi:hypothetical protein
MAKTYTFTLGEDDVPTFIGTLQYNQHDLEERNRKETDVLEPEFEMNLEELRVLKIIQTQYEDQLGNGPMVGLDLRLDLAEPLQMALYAQWAFAKQKLQRYLTMVANPMVPADAAELLHLEIKQYIRQIEALEVVMRQVGRHV